jgi:hypothetical protein
MKNLLQKLDACKSALAWVGDRARAAAVAAAGAAANKTMCDLIRSRVPTIPEGESC